MAAKKKQTVEQTTVGAVAELADQIVVLMEGRTRYNVAAPSDAIAQCLAGMLVARGFKAEATVGLVGNTAAALAAKPVVRVQRKAKKKSA